MRKTDIEDLAHLLSIIGDYFLNYTNRWLEIRNTDDRFCAGVSLVSGRTIFAATDQTTEGNGWSISFSDRTAHIIEADKAPDDGWYVAPHQRDIPHIIVYDMPNKLFEELYAKFRKFENSVMDFKLANGGNYKAVEAIASLWLNLDYIHRVTKGFLRFKSIDGKCFVRYDVSARNLISRVDLGDMQHERVSNLVPQKNLLERLPRKAKYIVYSDTSEDIMKEEQNLEKLHQHVYSLVNKLKKVIS